MDIGSWGPRAGNYALLNSLTHTKCFNHGLREAVARCPGCRRHFCRECVTEHEHRLLCARCIAAASAGAQARARRFPFVGAMQFSSAVALLWVTFYVMGQMLLLIPSAFHDSGDTFLDRFEILERERKAREDTGGRDGADGGGGDDGAEADSEAGGGADE